MQHHLRVGVVGVWVGLAVGCNGPPQGGEIRLEPPDPFSSDDVRLVVDTPFEDPNGDALELRVVWTQDGTLVEDLDDAQVVPAARTTRGEVWTVQVTASDGVDLGPIRTDEVTIRNAPPAVAEVTLAPLEPRVTDLVRATATSSDADGDPVSLEFRWEVDGVEVPGARTDRLPTGEARRGQQVVAWVRADDGELTSTEVASEPVTVRNSPPAITGANLSPTPPGEVYADSTLTCFAEGWTDADDDSPDYRWAWRVDGAVVGGEQDLSAGLSAGDEVSCEVTPDDGLDLGEPVASETIVVQPGSIYDCDPAAPLPSEPYPGRRLNPASVQVEGTLGYDRALNTFRGWCAGDGERPLAIELLLLDASYADTGSLADLCAVRLTPTADTVAGQPLSFRFDFGPDGGSVSSTHYGFTLRSGTFTAEPWRFRTASGDVVGSCLSRELAAPWPSDLGRLLESRDWTLAVGEISTPVRDSLRDSSSGGPDDPWTRFGEGVLFGASSGTDALGPGPLGYAQAYAIEPLTWTLAVDGDGELDRLDAGVAVPESGRPATGVYDLGSAYVWRAERLLSP